MDPKAIIETYVGDVTRHLPRSQRNDVGFELRSLLTEDLEGRASDIGRLADEAMTVELLRAFGPPQDVADRYRPAGFTVIRPADAPRFARIALIGVAVQWVVTLPVSIADAARADQWGRLGGWWLTWGLGAFWWPGFLITLTLIAAAIGHRRSENAQWTPPPTVDRDRINRPTMVLLLALAVLGAAIVIALPFASMWAPGLPAPVLAAFVFDPAFLQWRAPWVLLLWAASLVLAVTVLGAGRWSRVTHRISLVIQFLWLALLVWWLVAGPIFQAEAADGVTRLCLAGVGVIVVIDLIVSVRRLTAALRPPV